MKLFDLKSVAAGIIIGTFGVTTAFAAAAIQSAVPSGAKVMLNGSPMTLEKPLISVSMEGEQDASLYAPADELLAKLGYSVQYDSESDTVKLLSDNGASQEHPDSAMDFANNAGQRNIATSGAFLAEDNQTLVLTITSDIQGGTVDLFLLDPDGNEQRISIGSENMTKEIPLKKGTWQYNCSGLFKDGGNVRVVGTVR